MWEGEDLAKMTYLLSSNLITAFYFSWGIITSSEANILSISLPVITNASDFVNASSKDILYSLIISLTVFGSVIMLHVLATLVAIFYWSPVIITTLIPAIRSLSID